MIQYHKSSIIALVAVFCLVRQSAFAQCPEHSDAEIKAQFVFAGRCRHAEDKDSNYDYAFRMAAGDTNRYVRVLSELAEEKTNQIGRVISEFFYRKPPQRLPFLYSYASNAQYGAKALSAVFAIEGVTSNSLSVARGYLFSTNRFPFGEVGRRSEVCTDLIKKTNTDPSLAEYRPLVLGIATNFLNNVELMPNVLDGTLCNAYDGFRMSKRRLFALRSAMQRVVMELEDAATNNYEAG